MKPYQAEMMKIKEEMDQAQPKNIEELRAFRARANALRKKHNVNPLLGMLMPMMQIPVFLGFYWGLQKAPHYFADFAQGGVAWFPDPAVPDPIYALPVLSSALMIVGFQVKFDTDGGLLSHVLIVMNQVGKDAMPAEMADKMTLAMSVFSIVLIPVTVKFSSVGFSAHA